MGIEGQTQMTGRKDSIIFHFILLIVVTGFMLVGAKSTSPLYPNYYGADSAYFRFTGKEILRHKIPYIDFWDHKGPVIFFIQAIGALQGTNNRGGNLLFFMQTVSLYISILLLFRIDQRIHSAGRKRYFIFAAVTVITLSVLFQTGEGMNLTEDWSFPLICLSLDLFILYTASEPEAGKHPPLYAFIHGINFGIIAFLRIINGISIITGALVTGIYLLIKKEYKNFLLNLLAGIAGIAAAAIPIMLWFHHKGALDDMIYGTFLYNIRYSQDKVILLFSPDKFLLRYLPVIACFLMVLFSLFHKKASLTDLLVLAVILSNAVLLVRINTFLHYSSLFIPVFMLVLILYLEKKLLLNFIFAGMVFVFFTVMNIQQIPKLITNMNKAQSFQNVGTLIPQAERESVIAINTSAEIYLNTGLVPISRYSAYQSDYFAVDTEIRKRFFEEVREKSPLWIIIRCSQNKKYPEISGILAAEYEEKHREYVKTDICFYRKK